MTLHPEIVLLGLCAGAATLLGGSVALRARARLPLIVGIGAGVVFGVAMLELLPEAINLAGRSGRTMLLTPLAGGLIYRMIGAGLESGSARTARLRHQLGPAMLTLHSLIDGTGVGLAFQVSPELGWGVAIAVLSHDLADGVNVVGLTLDRSDAALARRWLWLNAAGPCIGTVVGQMVHPPEGALALLLGTLSGIFVAIAAGEMLPRAIRFAGVRTGLSTAAIGLAVVAVVAGLQG